ncbi:MAG: hypothetical protein H6815_07010 [Phycisphaeraceae bacterium]|nr:hypothetical protein [Phycisphaerales bacterium]MCB9860189.1 hypothetical protein [Phycisphaeraceae bacterium]
MSGCPHQRQVEDMPEPVSRCPASPKAKWAARLGFFGFMFFLIKGLLWLIIPALGYLAMR